QLVRLRAAGELVVPSAAVERDLLDGGRGDTAGVELVVAAEALDDQRVVRALGSGHAHPRRQPDHRVTGPRADGADEVVRVPPVQDDRVGGAVAGPAAGG